MDSPFSCDQRVITCRATLQRRVMVSILNVCIFLRAKFTSSARGTLRKPHVFLLALSCPHKLKYVYYMYICAYIQVRTQEPRTDVRFFAESLPLFSRIAVIESPTLDKSSYRSCECKLGYFYCPRHGLFIRTCVSRRSILPFLCSVFPSLCTRRTDEPTCRPLGTQFSL